MKEKDYEIEICLGSVQSCIEAEKGGADRVELCDNLFEGGTTPSFGAIKSARQNIDIELAVMIRPRGGDFLYTDLEVKIMEQDIEMAIDLGADTIVFGLLNSDGSIDVDNTKKLIDKVNGRTKITFHRAFDVSNDLFQSLDTLKSLGAVDRILTSGGEPSVLEGLDVLQKLVAQAGDSIAIMAGCGINQRNFEKIRSFIEAPAYHMTASSSIESKMVFRNDRYYMGSALYPPEFSLNQVDPEKVKSFTDQ